MLQKAEKGWLWQGAVQQWWTREGWLGDAVKADRNQRPKWDPEAEETGDLLPPRFTHGDVSLGQAPGDSEKQPCVKGGRVHTEATRVSQGKRTQVFRAAFCSCKFSVNMGLFPNKAKNTKNKNDELWQPALLWTDSQR